MDNITESFYLELRDNCMFDEDKFNTVTKCVFDLHQRPISTDERSSIAIKLWEFSFLTISLLNCHVDDNDVYKIKNLKEGDSSQINKILYYLSNWFSYNKPIDGQFLKFGNWA